MRFALPLLSALAIAVAACGVGVAGSGEAPSSADDLLTLAREAMAEVDSYRFGLTIVQDSSGPIEINGQWQAPDDWRLNAADNAEVRWIEGVVYAREAASRGGEWLESTIRADQYPGFAPQAPVLELLDAVLAAPTDASGAPIVVTGTGSLGRVAFPIDVTLTIHRTNYRVLGMTVHPRGTCGVRTTTIDGTPVTSDIECTDVFSYRYYDFNEPVSIEVPEGFE